MDLDGILGYGYDQFGYLGNSFFDSYSRTKLEGVQLYVSGRSGDRSGMVLIGMVHHG